MAIKSILFNTEMVRAIMDGRKSCTRRLVKPQPDEKHAFPLGFVIDSTEKKKVGCFEFGINEYGGSMQCAKPPYQPGDILYVRETWGISNMDDESKMAYIVYRASEDQENEGCREVHLPDEKFEKMYESMAESESEWRPSIHMPKEAARIWLKVTDVRVERLRDIDEDGALREGAQGIRCDHVALGEHGCTDCMNTGWIEPPQVEFMQIWDSTIKKSDLDRYGWNANPYVFVIEFVKIDKPEEIQNA